MKKTIILIFLSLFFCACSIKLENKYYENEVVQYNDEVDKVTIKLKKKGTICLEKAILETKEIHLLLKLDENCNVKSGKYYDKKGNYIKDFPKNQRKTLSIKIKKYINRRMQIINN